MARWAEYLQQEQGADQAPRGAKPEVEVVPEVKPPKDPESPDQFSLPTPNFLDIRPARHILKRLEKKEFVELWHFTAEGCREAAAIDLATPNDTFGLVDTGNSLVLQTIGAKTTSTKVIRDEHLSWVQLTEAKTRMIGCLKSCGWNEGEISQLDLFYLSLDVHPIRAQPYGLEAVMRYQEQVRPDWTASLRLGATYSIAQVNNELIKECREEIGGKIQARHNVSLNISSEENITNTSVPHLTSSKPCYQYLALLHSTVPLHSTVLRSAFQTQHDAPTAQLPPPLPSPFPPPHDASSHYPHGCDRPGRAN